LWAIVGGFVNQDEKIEDAMIRELREETKIKVPEAVLKGCIQRVKVYDNPDRSLRGRTITHAYYIKLPDGELSRVKGSDDALKARWVPLAEIKGDNMFEDHYAVLTDILGL
jgi:bifunctional NMN adenylyltransferase/nudix hydrolase